MRICRLEAEFDLVKSAYFTEPEDQSAWLYHRWLMSQAIRLCIRDESAAQVDANDTHGGGEDTGSARGKCNGRISNMISDKLFTMFYTLRLCLLPVILL